MATVCVYVVTYRRPALLKRALRSLISQTVENWRAHVLNDDPEDQRVRAVIDELGDARIELFLPAERRGGTGNFNLAFRKTSEPFASILEDDNWWEPQFLAVMLDALSRHAGVTLACGNERIWTDDGDGVWRDTGRTIWPPDGGECLLDWKAADKCGSARLCNSAMLFRTEGAERMRTPESIPIDVTEHFRERVVPHPFLLVHEPLVNYADSESTHRSRDMRVWTSYQHLLVGSVFAALGEDDTRPLARTLWQRARNDLPFLETTLLGVGLFEPEARSLWQQGSLPEKLRFALHSLRHPLVLHARWTARQRHTSEWDWLVKATNG